MSLWWHSKLNDLLKKMSQMGQRKDLKTAMIVFALHIWLLYLSNRTVFSKFFIFRLTSSAISFPMELSKSYKRKMFVTICSTTGRWFIWTPWNWLTFNPSIFWWIFWKFLRFLFPVFDSPVYAEQMHEEDKNCRYMAVLYSPQTWDSSLCGSSAEVPVRQRPCSL